MLHPGSVGRRAGGTRPELTQERRVPVIAITAADDSRVHDYRAVREPEIVRRRGLFIAEGRLVVGRLLGLPHFRIRSILVSAAGLAALREHAAAGLDSRPDLPLYLVDGDVIDAIGGFHFHRGCLAIAERPEPLDPDAIIAAAAPGRPLVVVEAIAQADNVGSILRNAQAFGAAGVLLDPASVDPLYRKALRTAMGAALSVPWARLAPWPESVSRLREAGIVIAALTPRAMAQPLDAFAGAHADRRVALLVGSEGAGLGDAALGSADVHVRIPMAPGADSVNVATATGIALHALAQATSARTDPPCA
jgi:tRNA G18 (ribose-2'-O)-methylase SpoU